MSSTGVWSNSGTVTIDTGGTLGLEGSFSTASLAGFTDQAGGTVVLESGTLNNTGATLSVGSGGTFNPLTLGAGGTIAGGIISDAGNGILFKDGTLNGVSNGAITYEGTMNVTSSGSTYVIISGNTSGVDTSTYLTVTGAGGTGAGRSISAPITMCSSLTARLRRNQFGHCRS